MEYITLLPVIATNGLEKEMNAWFLLLILKKGFWIDPTLIIRPFATPQSPLSYKKYIHLP